MKAPCEALIDIQRPARFERVRDFQPPWRTVYVYVCPTCGSEHRIHKSWHGSAPAGAIRCGRGKAK